MFPKISIVTPSYNQGRFIEQTIQSVLQQKYPNLEYIIIDGGSTDETIDIIKKYEDKIKFWVSEKDKGQANAINKGLKHCTGEIFNWLNSDDYLEAGALFKIAEAFKDSRVQVAAGVVRNFSLQEEERVGNTNLSAKGLMCWEKGVQFVQPGVWLRRDLLAKSGGVDEQFHYAFDWDLYIRYLYHFPQVKEINNLLVHFRLHDNSKTQSMIGRFAQEERLIIKKLAQLPEFSGLHTACQYKIQKTSWTEFLSGLSLSKKSFPAKLFKLLFAFPSHSRVGFSRQTLGAIKAYWQGRQI